MLKHVPILMSTMMMQALIAGTKTETRRTVKPQPRFDGEPNEWWMPTKNKKFPGEETMVDTNSPLVLSLCPYGSIGDILWCRETTREFFTEESGWDEPIVEYATGNPEPMPMCDGDGFQMFKADGSEKFIPWTPAIHMPKDYCRKWLQITNIGIEQLKDITEDGAVAEGVIFGYSQHDNGHDLVTYHNYLTDQQELITARYSYFTLFEKINGKELRQVNPWVWVIKFKEVAMPADFLKK